jgi:hypothetical protein
MKEHDIAKELMRWAGYNIKRYPCLELLHHVANEGKRDPRKVKESGVLPGLPDYHLPVPAAKYCGFWLELKAPGKKPTKQQDSVMKRLSRWSNFVCWTDNLTQSIFYLEWYVKQVTFVRTGVSTTLGKPIALKEKK